MSTANPKSIDYSRPSRGWIYACIGFVVLGLLFLGIGSLFGNVFVGEEFSPFDFQIRDFEYKVSLGKNLHQDSYALCDSTISKYLLVHQVRPEEARWDLVRSAQKSLFPIYQPAEAALLVDQLRRKDEDKKKFWENWSKRNVSLAKILWPAVQNFAIHHAYFALPELLTFAEHTANASELENAVARISRSAAVDQANFEAGRGRTQDALRTVAWGKSFGESQELDALESQLKNDTNSK